MKLLLDQNLSPKLISALSDLFPETTHVQNIGLDFAADEEVWSFAKANGYIIITKDSDFAEHSLVLGHPPKVIWIRRGNCSTKDIEKIIKNNFEDIKLLNETKTSGLISFF